jgi:hypothetical protein
VNRRLIFDAHGPETLSKEQAKDANGKFFVELHSKALNRRVEAEDRHKASVGTQILAKICHPALAGHFHSAAQHNPKTGVLRER